MSIPVISRSVTNLMKRQGSKIITTGHTYYAFPYVLSQISIAGKLHYELIPYSEMCDDILVEILNMTADDFKDECPNLYELGLRRPTKVTSVKPSIE